MNDNTVKAIMPIIVIVVVAIVFSGGNELPGFIQVLLAAVFGVCCGFLIIEAINKI